jgi:Beta-lactamase enzyme family
MTAREPVWQSARSMPCRRRPLALVLAAAPLWLCACGQGEPVATVAAAFPVAAPVRPVARAAQTAPTPVLTKQKGIEAAKAYARSRAGTVGFAVLDERGRLRGVNRTVAFPSASVVKAMLMVAVLRRARDRPLTGVEAALLRPMITVSDNKAADQVYASVGGAGLSAVARAAGSRRFADVGYWANAKLTPADQARLFLRIDRLVPARHRRYARGLLSSIVSTQRWGIPRVAARHHMKVFFKGGWRTGMVHQVALLERHGRRIALAILTDRQPSQGYGQATLGGIAARVLG